VLKQLTMSLKNYKNSDSFHKLEKAAGLKTKTCKPVAFCFYSIF